MGPRIAIPRVELLEELGRGAHSVVYRVRREGQFYALKLPLHGETDPELARLSGRFRREAVALARVRHPALPAVMEVGQSDGVPYIIMELAAGQTLAGRLRQGRLTEAQIVELGRQLADALAAIHDSGLVHRDVKPKNIVFDQQTTAARLVDFGFAVGTDVPGATEARAGTPAYMAPEQLSDFTERVDGRADLFSLGCVLFEAATGVQPLPDADPLAAIEHRSESASDAVDATPPISRALANVIRRLLAFRPDDRYATAEALRDELDHLHEEGPRLGIRRPDQLPIAGPLLPLVAREREIDRLRTAWIDAQAGPGRLVIVRGAAGSGKTRLVRKSLDDVARAGRPVLVASAEVGRRQPFTIVRQLLEGHVACIERLGGADHARAVARFRALAGDVAPLLRVLSPELARVFADAPPIPRFEDAEHVFAESLTEFLLRLLRDIEPAALFVDNAHSIDPGSRRVLTRLVDRLAGTSLLLILAAPATLEEAPAKHFFDLVAQTSASEIWLRALDEPQIMLLAQNYLGRAKVDTEVLRTVAQLSDGSPLCTLEVVRAMLDAGVLLPWWGSWKLDRVALARMKLPREAAAILASRIGNLNDTSRSTLRAAALYGAQFEDALLPLVTGLGEGVVHAALAEGRRALLIQSAPHGKHRFVHDSVRDALIATLSEQERRSLHQNIAEALDRVSDDRGASPATDSGASQPAAADTPSGPSRALATAIAARASQNDVDRQYALARHYAGGQVGKKPRRVFETNVLAGRLAFEAFDNEQALEFFEMARDASKLVDGEPLFTPDVEVFVAEARLRTGAIEESRADFNRVVDGAAEPELKALALSRIAWIELQLDSEAAWRALGRAFRTVRAKLPTDSVLALIASVVAWLWARLVPARVVRKYSERRRLETIVGLYYLAGRLAVQTAKPLLLVQATLRAQAPARRIGPSDALTRSLLMLSFVLTALGFRNAGGRYLARAKATALETRDPVVQAHAVQLEFVILAWAGDIRGSIEAAARSVQEFGHWRELAEFCVSTHTLAQIESVRGRARDAWRWLDLAIRKVNQHEGAPIALDYLELAARAALTCLGREQEAGALLGRLRNAVLRAPGRRAIVASTQGSQVRLLTERGLLDADFETFVAEVRNAGHDPRRVHMEMTEYYVHVAHARVHAALRASPAERPKLLVALREAARNLRLAARIPLLAAHRDVVDACEAFLSGDSRRAERLFSAAQAVGEQEAAPWVLYAVHRGRAHLFEEQGRSDSARDQAKLAEALAQEHGTAYRLAWIREEFGLRSTRHRSNRRMSVSASWSLSSSSSSDSSSHAQVRRRGYLRALLRITEARAEELTSEKQASAVLDEIIQVLDAERGYLLLAADSARAESPSEVASRLRPIAARGRGFAELADNEAWDRGIVEDVLLLDAAAFAEDDLHGATGAPRTEPRTATATDARRSMIAAPIVLHDRALGALYLERASALGAFTERDGERLAAFAVQVPVALELARALYVRERAENALRNADKLEAVGKLAGGVAHDFNNMLTVILASTDMLTRTGRDPRQDVETIRSAAERARDLTRQLMAFARGQYLNPEKLQLNDSIRRLEAVFRRLLGPTINLELQLDPDLFQVKADGAQIDQILTNLTMNAGDAMPQGGRLVIETANAMLDDEYTKLHPDARPGRHAMIVVADTGEGMDAATQARIFEPFFTTKGDRSGTGLGLASVYGIVKQSGGHILVESTLGVGTVFRIYLPRASESIGSVPPPAKSAAPGGSETILVVDDEPLVRDSLRRMLLRLGYHVLVAEDGREALLIAARKADEIALMITDVLMPGMNGLELAREVAKLSAKIKVLFVSGYTDGVLAERGILRERVEFLEKPIAFDVLAKRVREVLDALV